MGGKDGIKEIGLISKYPGIGFYLYSLILFIIITLTYIGYIKTSLLELSFYMVVSTALGTTLQFLSTMYISLKVWRATRDQPLLTKLATSNLGVFFYGYSIMLLWTSTPFYLIRDYGTYISLTQFGILSTLIGLYLHIISDTLTTGRKKNIPIIFAIMFATISSTILFYNILTPIQLKPLQRLLISLGYFKILILSYLATSVVFKSVLTGFGSMILIAMSPVTIKLAKSGEQSLMIFSATYVALFLLIFYFRETRYATPLAIMVIAIQATFSKAYLLSIILATATFLYTFIREKHYNYVIYTPLFTSLAVLFYVLIYSQNLLKIIFETCTIYYIISLTLSTFLSISFFIERDTTTSSKISIMSLPLLLGTLLFFKESYTALIYIAIMISSFLLTYLTRSISIDRLGEEEVEITIKLDKFLVFTPIILLLITSVTQ